MKDGDLLWETRKRTVIVAATAAVTANVSVMIRNAVAVMIKKRIKRDNQITFI